METGICRVYCNCPSGGRAAVPEVEASSVPPFWTLRDQVSVSIDTCRLRWRLLRLVKMPVLLLRQSGLEKQGHPFLAAFNTPGVPFGQGKICGFERTSALHRQLLGLKYDRAGGLQQGPVRPAPL